MIPDADKVELSYNKRESVLRQDKLALHEAVAKDFLFAWSPASDRVIETTGAPVDAYTPSATGRRKGLCRADILTLMTKFNSENIPQEGRYLLLDAQMYAQLLSDLTANENSAFLASADAQNGIIGKLFSFNVMMRSQATLYTADKAPKRWAKAVPPRTWPQPLPGTISPYAAPWAKSRLLSRRKRPTIMGMSTLSSYVPEAASCAAIMQV